MSATGMTAGSVTVADDETATGTGLAKALYDAHAASMIANNILPAVPALGDTTAPWSAARPVSQPDIDGYIAGRLLGLREVARTCTANAMGLVAYMQSNAVAVIAADATGDGLQSGTTHPATEKLLGIR